jgi:outer membrane murein-binding lipoprotein Lpp
MKTLFVAACFVFLLAGCAAHAKKSAPPSQAETQAKGNPHVYR